MAKKIKERKIIHGKDITSMAGHRSWITCFIGDERFSISFKQLYALLDQMDLVTEEYGDHFRTIAIIEAD